MTHTVTLTNPLGLIPEPWTPPAPLFVPSFARSCMARGTETLWHEQCVEYAQRAQYLDARGWNREQGRVTGTPNRARDQITSAQMDNARRGFARLAQAQTNRSLHRVQYPAAYTGWTADQMADRQPCDVLVPDRQADRWVLEAEADAWLAADPIPGIDVTVRGHLQVKPDRVAYRGQVRYRRPRPCRYHSDGIARGAFVVDADGVITRPAVEYRTDVTGRGYGWMGHRRITIGTTGKPIVRKARQARSAATQANRPTVARRGKAVSWWAMSERSLPRWWTKATDQQVDAASMMEAIMRTSVGDTPVTLADGHIVIVDRAGACVRRDEPASRTMPIREYARRAVLAGLIAD